jgi:hypothetical protein
MIQHDVSNKGEIGRIILREGARLEPGEQIQLRFVNGSAWLGSVTVSRDDYSFYGDLSFNVEGNLFEGDRSVQIAIVCEPDGPVDWPIRHNGRIYTSEEESEYGNQTRAQFYADGPGWNADNAPKVKPFFASASARAGQKLASEAEKAQKSWQKGQARVKTEKGMQWFTAKELLQAGPETDIWPRPMPKPQRAVSSGPKKEKSQAKRVKSGVHKRLSTGEKVAVTQSV